MFTFLTPKDLASIAVAVGAFVVLLIWSSQHRHTRRNRW